MKSHVAVVGGGFAGQVTVLLLARRGFRVELFERDAAPPERLEDVYHWQRPGAPQSRHAHILMGLFRKLLREHLPDVYSDLLAHGVTEAGVALPPGVTSSTVPDDPDLAVLSTTRATVEWGLHRALCREPNVSLRYQTSVRGIDVAHGRVRAVRFDSGMSEVDAVVDATGSRSKLFKDFLVPVEEEDCQIVYNARFYRLLDGVPTPPMLHGPVTTVFGPGYRGGLVCHSDRRFEVGIGRLPEDSSLKGLREPGGFDRALATMPQFEPWVRADVAEVLTDVIPMAGLRNVWRTLAKNAPAGYVAVGDALCTVDPTFGRGSSLALAEAVRLASAFAEAPHDLPGITRDVTGELLRWVRPWYEDTVRGDRERTAMWRAEITGSPLPEPVGPGPNLGLLMAAGVHDHVLWQTAQRYVNLLALPEEIDVPETHERLRAVLATGWLPVAPPAPSYPELVDAVAGAA